MHNSLCFVCLRIIQCIQSHRWICRTSFNHHSHVCNTSFHFLRLFLFIDKQRNYQFYSHGLFTILFKVNLKYPLTAKYCSFEQTIREYMRRIPKTDRSFDIAAPLRRLRHETVVNFFKRKRRKVECLRFSVSVDWRWFAWSSLAGTIFRVRATCASEQS